MPHNHSPDTKQIAVSNFPTDYFKQGQYIGGFGIPDGGIQVAKSATAENATVIIHTVTAGKTLYLSFFSVRISSHVNQSVTLKVRNDLDVDQYESAKVNSYTGMPGFTVTGNLNPPLEIPAGWDVVIVSPGAGAYGHAFIHGYEA